MTDRTDPPGPAPAAVVVVGASAGGVEALCGLVRFLPRDLRAAVLVVLHVPADGTSTLPAILGRAGPLPARHVVDGDRLWAGQVLVAPPDHHLEVVDDRATLTRGPHENGQRPAVDVLFRTAARSHGDRVVSVVLSGALDDGAAGTLAVDRNGGRCLAQDPDEALYGGMPTAAGDVARCEVLDVRALAQRVVDLVAEMAARPPGPGRRGEHAGRARVDILPGSGPRLEPLGEPAGYGCPECGGALFPVEDGPLQRFRCRVGHAWSVDSLVQRKSAAMESALWMALRGLEEKALLNQDLADRCRERGSQRVAERFDQAAREASHAAGLVRRLVEDLGVALDPAQDAGRPDLTGRPA